jgi:nitrogenase iron protein NifH
MLGTKVIGKVSMSTLISKAEMHHKTVVEYAPTSDAAQIFHEVAQKIYNNVDESIPKPLSDEEIDSITGEIDLAVK